MDAIFKFYFSRLAVRRYSSKKFSILLVSVFLFASVPLTATAELLPLSDKTAKMIGVAATVPESTRRVLIGMVTYCSQFGEKSKDVFEHAFSDWLLRHQEYLAESARVKADLIALIRQAGNPPPYLKDIEKMYAIGIPQMISAKIARNTKSIEILPSARAKASRCMADAQMINNGLWDLKVNHPDAAQFLDERRRGEKK